ncbi:MAG: hypothetical protein ACRDO1_21035, partial [Nocardioidaceae bacterium]
MSTSPREKDPMDAAAAPMQNRFALTGIGFAYLVMAIPVLVAFVLTTVGTPLVLVTAGIPLLLVAVPLTQGMANAHRGIAGRV